MLYPIHIISQLKWLLFYTTKFEVVCDAAVIIKMEFIIWKWMLPQEKAKTFVTEWQAEAGKALEIVSGSLIGVQKTVDEDLQRNEKIIETWRKRVFFIVVESLAALLEIRAVTKDLSDVVKISGQC